LTRFSEVNYTSGVRWGASADAWALRVRVKFGQPAVDNFENDNCSKQFRTIDPVIPEVTQMKLVGNILTVLILLMSAFFFAVAIMTVSTHRNWKQAADTLQIEYNTLNTKLQAAKTGTIQKEQSIIAEKVARAQQLAQLESQLANQQADVDNLSKLLNDETIISKERLARMEQAEARAAQLDRQNKSLTESNVQLNKEVATSYEKLTDLTNTTFELSTRIEEIEKLNQDLSASVAKSNKILKLKGWDENELTNDIVPLVNAVVVKSTGPLFAVAAGSDDGLREGHILDIYRADSFVGRGVVREVQNDLAVLETVREFMQASVKEGDNVTSKF
jgi:hypothetical protein